MLAIFNNTFLDTRTELEKQLDEFIEKRNETKRLNNNSINSNYSLLPIPVLALSSVNENIDSIASFCRSVKKFFSTTYLILTNIPKISFYVCLISAIVGFLIYSIWKVEKGKTIAVISTTLFILVQLISWVFKTI